MSKSFKFGTVIFSLILIFLTFSMSFAWYQAKVNQGTAINLASESIEITFNSSSNALSPDVLAEGVVIIKDGNPIYPSDYETNDDYYISRKSYVRVVEDVEVYLNKFSSIDLLFTLSYQAKDGTVKTLNDSDLVKYLDIKYAIASGDTYELTSYNGLANVVLNNEVTSYKLYLEISYKLPDELLPIELISSDSILLVVNGSLA